MGQRAAGLGNHLPGMAHIADAGCGDVDIQGGSRIAHIAHIGGAGSQLDLVGIKGMDL